MKLNEQIAYLRKQKGMTQEELAVRLGVTNQSVSKWESAQCCPDIGLLPELAKILDVSIDTLMGYGKPESFEEIGWKLKEYFDNAPQELVFRDSFRTAVLLHEELCWKGYYLDSGPWGKERNYWLEDPPHRWDFSAANNPDGSTVYAGGGIYFSTNRAYTPPTQPEILELSLQLKKLSDRNTLRVLYALYDLTADDFDRYASLEGICTAAKMTEEEVLTAMENLELTVMESDTGELVYRIDGSRMHIPALLRMLRRY